MSIASTGSSRSQSILSSGLTPDQRRFKRFPIVLLGRFMRANKQEYPCKLNNFSVGGAAVMSPVEVEIGERIVAYFDEIGGVEGKVVRLFDGGFAMEIKATAHKRDKLAALLTWLVNRHDTDAGDGRRHKRISVANKLSTMKLPDGNSISCTVLDVSLSGASIGTEARPPIGSDVLFGKMRCRVMRYHEKGIGVLFLDIPDPEALRRYFV